MLKLGAAAGTLFGLGGAALAWPPGPDEKLKKDLTPGKTPIRLATGMGRNGNEDFEVMVKRVRDGG